jgi:PAS domain S-box-containing protein
MLNKPKMEGIGYLLAVAATALALMVRVAVAPWLFEKATFIPFFMAILLVAWFGGLRPGLLATVLSALAGDYFLIPPKYNLWIGTKGDGLQLILFCITAVAICLVCESLHGARRRAEAKEHELEKEARERRDAEAAERAERERWSVALEHSPAAIAMFDNQMRYLMVSRRWMSDYDLGDANIIGHSHYEVFPELPERWKEIHRRCLAGASERSDMDSFQRSDGGTEWVRWEIQPWYEAGGKQGGVFIFSEVITARKQAEEARRDSEARMSGVVHSAVDGIITIDEKGLIESFNPAAEKLFGYMAAEAIGQNVKLLVPEPFQGEHDSYLANYLSIGRAKIIGIGREVEGRRKDGSTFPLNLSISQFLLGQRRYFTGIVRDITERRLAEEALRESEQKFRVLADAIPQLAWTARADGFLEWYNRRWYEYTGTTPQQMEGWGWQSVHDPQALPMVMERWKASIASGEPFEMVFPLRGADGRFRSFLTRVQPLKDAQGRVTQWFGTNTDVDQIKRAEDALRESEQRMQLATEATEVGIWEWNVITGEVRWDAQMFRIFGIAPTKDGFVQYSTWSESVVPEDLPKQEEVLQDTIRRLGHSTRTFRIRRRDDGECRYIHAVEAIRTDAQGQAQWLVGTNLDITERKQADDALKESDRRKDEFLATLAHELRNPLAPIRNGLQIMRLSSDNPEAVEQARIMMDRQLGQMVRLVDDLLDVNRIGRGKLELRKSRVELAAVLNNAVETSRPIIETGGQQFTVSLPSQPIFLDADMTRLGQAFTNLLNNAAKFSEPGGRIELTAERQGSDVVVRVTDCGIGIPPEMLHKIFDLFTQVDRSLERARGGLGIGLTLVKRLVEMHGGSVEARSDGPGRGSEFVVRLPILIESPKVAVPEQSPEQPARTALRILVVDDNHDLARSLAKLLKLIGNETHIAHDGLEAIELAARVSPDVVLMDIGMPKLNGYDAARRIREQPWGKELLLVAVTGWGQDEDRRQSQEAGFDEHMVKPVDFTALTRVLAKAQVRQG